MHHCNIQRLQDKITCFSQFGATKQGGITRLSLSTAALAARAEFIRRCQALDMEVKTDDLGNIYATLPGLSNLPSLATGSHLDSVVNGGNYDGVLGVLAGLEVVETLRENKIHLRHPLTLVVWTNEEGARFDPAMMCSGIVAGKFNKQTMLASCDKNGIPFEHALEKSGMIGDEENRINKQQYSAFLELHIEQGPVLESETKDIGVVQGVVGMVNYEICVMGKTNHAGTTPQHVRQDALYTASSLLTKLWKELSAISPSLVFTTGRMNVQPNVHTVIPGEVRFTLDARHQSHSVLNQVVEVIQRLPKELNGCAVTSRQLWARDTVKFAPKLISAVQAAANEYEYTSMKMYSGAGHDAQYIASILPTAMIFVPSVDGRSHCPEEFTPIEACAKGVNVLLDAIMKLDGY